VRPHVVDLQEGRKPDAPVIRTNPKGKGNIQISNRIDGDIEAGFKQADQVIEYDFNMPAFSSHIPNPAGGVSWWYDDLLAGEGQNLWIEGATQNTATVASMYNLPMDKVQQNTMYQGGKYCDWGLRKCALITPLLAKRTGKPVRMANTRKEMYDFGANQRLMHLKVGFKNDGLITAIDDFSIADGGVRGSSSFGTSGDQGYGPYPTTKCLNVKQSMEIVNSNRGKMYTSGQHCPFNWDALTTAFHLIAEKLGMDPIDVAIKNVHGPSSQTDTIVPPSLLACVASGKKLMNWQWHPTSAKKLPDGRMHGASFRYQMSPRHSGAAYSCTVVLKGGKVYLPTQGPCTGIYAMEANAMVVAEELGIRYEDVVIEFDTKAVFTPVGGGSDGTTASAWVTKEAAIALKKQILEAAAPNLKAKAEDLDIKEGRIFVKSDPGKSIPLAQAARGSLAASYNGRPPLSIWSQGMGKMLDTMNTAMCEVAVDTETGEVEVLRFVVAADTGKIIRRTSLESQIYQVMYFSGGTQLSEDYFYDKATGVKLNANMFEYKKPTILDIAPVQMDLLETRAGNAAYGANGISHSLANTHLIICAIQNAIGKWVDPPATPDKVLKALGKA
jgi:xanthine dehydrogenase molybdenum-binding subunit